MKVYKFGGASIANPASMAALLPIVTGSGSPLLLVVSALGKTTNALEKIVDQACAGNLTEALALVDALEKHHLDYAAALLDPIHLNLATGSLAVHFHELRTAASRSDASRYDESYDQIVSIGDLLSTCIFAWFLLQSGVRCSWVDARQVVATDDTYRDAIINWRQSQKQAAMIIGRQLDAGMTVITQGFIGAGTTGRNVTLGREGSDYSAAVLAAMLHLQSVTIWKDVDGFRSADPKLFPDTVKIDAISYNEVIEMAFYGAQIIHPKTIKPLQNNNIPLYVRCFLNPGLSGTVIQESVPSDHYPPLIVLKQNQVLLQVTTRDYSFITEDNLSKLYAIFHDLKVRINIIQNAAISFVTSIDNREDKVAALVAELGKDYKVLTNHGVSLLTIRHHNPQIFATLTAGRQVLLRQETRKTLQVVVKD